MPKRWIDVTGKTFHKLTVLHCKLPPPFRAWVQCECGKELSASIGGLISSKHTSCRSQLCSTRVKSGDLSGQTFGFLTVKEFSGQKNKRGELIWTCQCVCGNIHFVKTGHLLHGVKSCGCQTSSLRSTRLTMPLRETFVHGKYTVYKNQAKRGKKSFALTQEEFEAFLFADCHYCGCEPLAVHTRVLLNKSDTIKWNGIDRIDSLKGYTTENCVPCCKICNAAKSDLTLSEFTEWALRLANHMKRSIEPERPASNV